jgi:putative transposase
MGLHVHAANIQDKPGAVQLLERFSKLFSRLEVIFADGAYLGDTVSNACKLHHDSRVEVVRRNEGAKFEVLPKRWVVERTFAWIGRNRRLSKDYEELITVSEAFVALAMLRLMVGRATK